VWDFINSLKLFVLFVLFLFVCLCVFLFCFVLNSTITGEISDGCPGIYQKVTWQPIYIVTNGCFTVTFMLDPHSSK